MKKITLFSLLNLFFISSLAFAQSNTDMNSNDNSYGNSSGKTSVQWVCTTNASGGTTADETNADEQMKKPNNNAKSAFEFALSHCRDCTKITCTQED